MRPPRLRRQRRTTPSSPSIGFASLPSLDVAHLTTKKGTQGGPSDGGFVDLRDIEAAQSAPRGCKVYTPVPKPKGPGRDRPAPLPTDSEQAREWRQRMGTDEAKALYRQRASTIECVNAQARDRGLVRLLVRGARKVKAVALWF